MKSKEEILDSGILEQYALGLTTEEENQEVASYLEFYPDLKEHLDTIERAMEIIAHQQAIVPPSHLREATIRKVLSHNGTPHNQWTRWITGIAAVVAICAIGYGLKLQSDMRSLGDEMSLLENKISLMDKDCSLVKDDYANSQRLLNMYRNDNFLPVNLRGNKLMPGGEVVVFWNATDKQACMKIHNLKAPPSGYTYQIWADVEGEMVSVGTFKDESGIINLKFLEDATSLNVTIEEGKGKDHPDVSKLIMSSKV